LTKWYQALDSKDKSRILREVTNTVTKREQKSCNFFEYKDFTVVYRRYASIFFVLGIDKTDNELIALEMIHNLCVCLDKYFGSVCELDLVFNIERVHLLLDEYILAGEIQEPSAAAVVKLTREQDADEQSEIVEEALAQSFFA
jgi:hypothetical protein